MRLLSSGKYLNRILLTGLATVSSVMLFGGCARANISFDTDPEDEDWSECRDLEIGAVLYRESIKSDDGWSVEYDPDYFDVVSGDDYVDFIYNGGYPDVNMNYGENLVEFRFISDEQPAGVLAEITDSWNAESEIIRKEGIFPGTDDKWGYWRILQEGDTCKTAIAGEYNGGVLLIYTTTNYPRGTGDDLKDDMEDIVDSITYENFEPQVIFDFVPGKYVMNYTDEIEGQEITAEYSITLNEDHTGVISMQDDIPVLWGDNELIYVSGYQSEQYTVEGDKLLLNLDGKWVTFERQ